MKSQQENPLRKTNAWCWNQNVDLAHILFFSLSLATFIYVSIYQNFRPSQFHFHFFFSRFSSSHTRNIFNPHSMAFLNPTHSLKNANWPFGGHLHKGQKYSIFLGSVKKGENENLIKPKETLFVILLFFVADIKLYNYFMVAQKGI